MEPLRERHATLVDLLDRVLDKGVVLHADVIVSVAGIPLIGVTLRAALAGMETMLQYGLMEAWDERIRAWEQEQREVRRRNLLDGQRVVLNTLGAQFCEEGIYTAWRYGHFYLTHEHLIQYHKTYDEVLLNVKLARIRGMTTRTEQTFSGESCEVLYVVLDNDKVHRLRSPDVQALKNAVTSLVSDNGTYREQGVSIPEYEDSISSILAAGEEVTHRGKLWHLCEEPAPGSIVDTTWRPGKLYLTNHRLCWEHQTESRVHLDIPLDSVCGCNQDERSWSLLKQKSPVMDLIYEQDATKQVASFSGEGVADWCAAIQGALNQTGKPTDRETESCPQCGRISDLEELLHRGCPHCNWLSARMKRKALGVPV